MAWLNKFKKILNPNQKKFESTIELINLIQEKKYIEALALHEKYFDGNNSADLYTKGNILLNLNRHREALDCYLKAIEIKDTYIKAWFRLGQTYFEFGNFEEARSAFIQVSALERKIGENEWNTLATFYYMMSLYMEYLNTKDEEIKEKLPNEIRKLRDIIDVENGVDICPCTDDEFLDYCKGHFQDIVAKFTPNVVVEFRHKKSIN